MFRPSMARESPQESVLVEHDGGEGQAEYTVQVRGKT
jgi:hypothetical protein